MRFYTGQLFTYLSFVLLFTACSKEQPKFERPPVEVKIITVETADIEAIYEYVGFAQSSHEVEIRSQVTGSLESIDYAEGGFVEKGSLLFTIDPRPFAANLDSAKADLAKQEAVLWEAKRSVERLNTLFEKKATSRRDLDNAISTELSSEALVESGKAKVREAQLNLDYATIHAPISGAMGSSNFRLGALIVSNQSLLSTISVIDPIWVNFSVSERDILQSREEVKRGELKLPVDDAYRVEVILADSSALPEMGKVDFLSPTFDQKTGTMRLRAVIPNPEGLLRPGQFVRAKIYGAIRPDAIVVPQRAVVQSKKGLYVYVVNAKDEAEIRYVEAGGWYKEDWIIKSGLKINDQVIVDGVNKVQPGAKVKTIIAAPS